MHARIAFPHGTSRAQAGTLILADHCIGNQEICMRYNARHFDLSGLKGISDATLEQHFKLTKI